MVDAVDFLGHKVSDGDVLVRSVRSGNSGRMRISYVIDAKAGVVHSFGYSVNGGKGTVNSYSTSIVIPFTLLPKQFQEKVFNLASKLKMEEEVGSNFA